MRFHQVTPGAAGRAIALVLRAFRFSSILPLSFLSLRLMLIKAQVLLKIKRYFSVPLLPHTAASKGRAVRFQPGSAKMKKAPPSGGAFKSLPITPRAGLYQLNQAFHSGFLIGAVGDNTNW